MFKEIFRFELLYRLKRPATYIYLSIPFLLALYAFMTGSVAADQGQWYNAPAVIARFVTVTSFALLLIVSAIMGPATYRDVEYRSAAYYLSYPISKAGYFWGRFTGSLVFVLLLGTLLLLGAYLGCVIGSQTGIVNPALYGPNRLAAYLMPYGCIIFPNLLLPAALFYGLVAITRSIRVIYSGGVILLLAYLAARVYFDFTDNTLFSQLADPFAYNSIRLMTAGYSPAQLNTALISVSGLFLVNRLLWTSIAVIIAGFCCHKFSLGAYFIQKSKQQINRNAPVIVSSPDIPVTSAHFKRRYQRHVLATLVRVELRSIFRDNFFWTIVACCTLFEAFAFWLGTQNYQVRDFPRTVALLNIYKNDFLPYLFIIIIFYTGEVVHRERDSRFAVINDALPPSNGLFFGGKLLALCSLGMFLVSTPLLVCLLVQMAKGYTDFYPELYFQALMLVFLPKVLQMVLLAFFIHILVDRKFGGHLLGISAWLGFTLMAGYIGITYNLFLYSVTPFFNFSDMEGAGHMLEAVNYFNLYWLLAGSLLAAIAGLFYRRGLIFGIKSRLALARSRASRSWILTARLLLLLLLGCGGLIYYNISYLNNYQTEDNEDIRLVQYETDLNKYLALPLPQVSSMALQEDLFPEKQAAVVDGTITLVNDNQTPLDSLLLDGEALTAYTVGCNGKALAYRSLLAYDWGTFNWFHHGKDTAGCRIYYLPKTLAPGDSIRLDVHTRLAYHGFQNDLYGTDLLHNGSFLTAALPHIGYDTTKELSLAADREKYHLALHPARPGIARTIQTRHTALSSLDLIVGTSGNQFAVAPGKLIAQWASGGRKYFHYRTDKTGEYSAFPVVSATYAVRKNLVRLDSTRAVGLNIYYLPQHAFNIDRLAEALSNGMRCFDAWYGHYPYSVFSLAESSNYGPYRAAFPSLQTFAEYYSWIADLGRPDQFDYVYFEAAKQLARQWWNFKVIPGQAHSARVISEGLPTYSALRLYEKKYGSDQLKNLLQYELDNYLIPAVRDEMRSLLQADKSYDYEAKAAIVLYELQDLIGEAKMNTCLHAFADTFSNQQVRPDSRDLYRFLKRYTPDSLQYYLTDCWEKITYYDNRLLAAAVKPAGSGRYTVTLKIKAAKWYAGAKGDETAAKGMADYIDVGVFGEDTTDKMGNRYSSPLYLQKIKLTSGVQTLMMVVNGKPSAAAIDPYHKLIDRNTGDNRLAIK